METKEAFEVVKSLAYGVNPVTGEVFAKDSPYQDPTIVRALFEAVNSLQRRIEWEKKKKNQPERAGVAWSDTELKALLDGFDSGKKLEELAKLHKRTVVAIRARLVMLGRLEEE